MRTNAHALAALPLAAGVFSVSDSAPLALFSALVSLGVDVDHIPDYLWWRGGWRGVRDFFNSYHLHQVVRMTVVLHSWELLPLSVLALHLLGWPAWAWAAVAGWLWHLAWDQLTNPVGQAFYFFFWRANRGFQQKLSKPLLGRRPPDS